MNFRKIKDFPLYELSLEGCVRTRESRVNVPLGKFSDGRLDSLWLTKVAGEKKVWKSIQNLLSAVYPEIHGIPEEQAKLHTYHKEGADPLIGEFSEFQKELRTAFTYDKDTGSFIGKARGNSGSLGRSGYRIISYKNKKYKVARLIMMYMLGDLPEGAVVDHVDRDRGNDCWYNLRLVCSRTNSLNHGKNRNNLSGHTGVCLHKPTGKWRAYIMVNRKHIHLGVFPDIQKAVQARKAAEQRYGFHPNSGGDTKNYHNR